MTGYNGTGQKNQYGQSFLPQNLKTQPVSNNQDVTAVKPMVQSTLPQHSNESGLKNASGNASEWLKTFNFYPTKSKVFNYGHGSN